MSEKQTQGWRWWMAIAVTSAGIWLNISQSGLAQNVTLDGTVGTARSLNGRIYFIRQSDGRTVGENLFHSFGRLRLNRGEELNFESNSSIRNIVARVTGGEASLIDGRIAVQNPTANLFLLNPSGIIFGPNAILNVGGSLIASTADSLVFADGTQFSARSPTSSPLLTLSVPVGLQFGQAPGSIIVERMGSTSGTGILEPEPIFTPDGLLHPERTVALVGGAVQIRGATFSVPAGRIELGSVASAGLVQLIPQEQRWSLAYEGVENFGTIVVSDSSLDVSSLRQAGDVQLQGGQVSLTDRSLISILPFIAPRPSEILIRADQLEVGYGTIIGNLPVGTSNGANITIQTDSLTVRNSGAITTGNATGDSGNLKIQAADSVTIDSGGFISVETLGDGSGGRLSIETGRLRVQNRGAINGGTLGGRSGTIDIRASDAIEVIGGSISVTSLLGNQPAGNLTLNTPRLTIRDGGSIDAALFGSSSSDGQGTGRGGNIVVRAESVNIQNQSELSSSVVLGSGTAGDIVIRADRVRLENQGNIRATANSGTGGSIQLRELERLELNNSEIAASTGTAQGGNIRIDAATIQLQANSTISAAATEMGGSAGRLTIDTSTLDLAGSSISASTLTGVAGRLRVNAIESIRLSDRSSIQLRATGINGQAGDLRLITSSFSLENSTVTVSSRLGLAGSLTLAAREVQLDRGQLTAETGTSGDQQGAIVNLQNLDRLLLQNQSLISAEAFADADGGNVNTDVEDGFVIGIDNSDIIANANRGDGGRINITTQAILGLAERTLSPATSDINASSEFGAPGTVQLNTPDADPSRGLIQLPTTIVDAADQINQTCPTGGDDRLGEFIITGRGGLPPNPNELLDSEEMSLSWIMPPAASSTTSTVTLPASPPQSPPLVEATSWIQTAEGQVMLVAGSSATHPGWNRVTCPPSG